MRVIVLFCLAVWTSGVAAQDVDNCIECHAEEEDEIGAPVQLMLNDVHARQGLSCADCHGGDPNTDDEDEAMWDAEDFRGAPDKDEIPDFCGSCHSDATYMRQYDPSLRVDQEALYHVSTHGRLLDAGDTQVATCISCHDAHGILPSSDPRSPVYPANVPGTCGVCHSDAEYMADYDIPTDQQAKYSGSVHGRPLLDGHDLSAPTCNDCHGNHGATPPGVKSLVNVCGQCHAVMADFVKESPHEIGYEKLGIAACTTCHSHHDIATPSDDMVGNNASAVCARCHSPEARSMTIAASDEKVELANLERGWQGAAVIRTALDSLRLMHALADSIARKAERAGMSVEDVLYDINEAHGRLTRARSVLHSFTPDRVLEVTGEGMELATRARDAGYQALDDLDYRREGLALSLIVIAVLGLALYAKIRDLDSERNPS